jgi:hypothetical protein
VSEIDKAQSIDQLAELASNMFAGSRTRYEAIALRSWKRMAGEEPSDSDAVAKDAMQWVGNLARDASNAALMWQRALTLAAGDADPGASKPEGPGGGEPAPS